MGLTDSKQNSQLDFTNFLQSPHTFGVGRDAFKNVVSCNKFNYTPFKAKDAGPGWYDPKKPMKR